MRWQDPRTDPKKWPQGINFVYIYAVGEYKQNVGTERTKWELYNKQRSENGILSFFQICFQGIKARGLFSSRHKIEIDLLFLKIRLFCSRKKCLMANIIAANCLFRAHKRDIVRTMVFSQNIKKKQSHDDIQTIGTRLGGGKKPSKIYIYISFYSSNAIYNDITIVF